MTTYRIKWDYSRPACRAEGLDFTFDIMWRPRIGSWYIDVIDSAGVYVLRGARLTANGFIGEGRVELPGYLVCIEPAPQRLGDEVLLYWVRP